MKYKGHRLKLARRYLRNRVLWVSVRGRDILAEQ